MPDLTYRLLSLKSPDEQIEWLEEQDEATLLRLHRKWGYGATECSCDKDADPPPCPEHHLSRFRMICRLSAGGDAEPFLPMTDAQLFGLIFPEFEGQDSCDCPALYAPCEHAFTISDSPFFDEPMDRLACLVDDDAYSKRPPAPTRLWARSRQGKVPGLEKRAEMDVALFSKDDLLNASRLEEPSDQSQHLKNLLWHLDRPAQSDGKRNRNGADTRPGRIAVYHPAAKPRCRYCNAQEPDEDDREVWDEVWEDADLCPDCKRARARMAKTLSRKVAA